MPPISLLIKPASSMCNLKCSYCFYHSAACQREIANYGLMSLNLLETIVIKALDYSDGSCTFAFQGGEPTLVGLSFYEKLVEFQKKHNKKGVTVHNALQTNGMHLNEEWAEFLAKNHFLVGLSLDGPKEIHDAFRITPNGTGSFKEVMNTVRLFNQYDVTYNILTVVNNLVARYPQKVYQFFKKNGFQYQQYIQCLDPLGEAPGEHPYSLTPKRYANFLKTIFDLWYQDLLLDNRISIRNFNNYVTMAGGYPPESCGMSGICSCYFVVESDGGVYPCDFYVLDQWKLGNIKENTFSELIATERGKRFVEESKHIDENCKACRWFSLCRGGCRRAREPFVDGKPMLNHYCSSYQEFFQSSEERIIKIANVLRHYQSN